MSHQRKYVEKLVEVLSELRDANVLPADAGKKAST